MDKSSPPSGFAKPDLHPKKAVLTVWWCCKGLIHYLILQNSETVTAEFFCCAVVYEPSYDNLNWLLRQLLLQQPNTYDEAGQAVVNL